MKNITAKSLEELWKNSVEQCKACKDNVLENALLGGVFDLEEINSDFINLHLESAEKWEAIEKPDELLINHGEFINNCGKDKSIKGIDFIRQELKNKKHGNRACYSLINMDDIVESDDNPIPSFMVLQFSFAEEDSDMLLVSAYFRALEVSKFLPINLAEICINIKQIKTTFPSIKKFELNIFAFRAQYIENFNCLKHSKLDIVKATTLLKYLMRDKNQVIELLKEKKRMVESVIIDKGMNNLKEAVEEVEESDLKNRNAIIEKICLIIEKMATIKQMRASTSIQKDIKVEYEELEGQFDKLIELMEAK